MRKALTVFGWLFILSFVLLWTSSLYLSEWNLVASFDIFTNIWNSIRRFVMGQHSLSEIQFFIAMSGVGLVVLATLILFIKLLTQRKVVVALISLLMLVYLIFSGMLGFIPYLDAFHLGNVDPSIPGQTFYEYLRSIIFDSTTEMQGYVFLGAFAFTGFISLLFIFIALADIIETPYAVAHVKKMKVVPVPVKDPVETELNKFEVPGLPTPKPSMKETPVAISPTPPSPPQPVTVTPVAAPVTTANVSLAEQMRLMIQEELKKNAPKDGDPFKNGPVMVATPWGMQPYTGILPTQNAAGVYPQQAAQQGITATNHDEVRSIVIQEIDRSVALKKEIAKLVLEELVRLSPPSKESVYSIINDELVKYDALNREAIDSLIDEKVEKFQQGAIESIKTTNEQVMHALVDARLETLKTTLALTQEKVIHEEIARLGANLPTSTSTTTSGTGLSENQVKQMITQELTVSQSSQLGVIRSIFAEELKTFIVERKKTNLEQPKVDSSLTSLVKDQEEDLEEDDDVDEEDDLKEEDLDENEETEVNSSPGSRLPQFESVVPKDSLLTKTGKKKIIKIPFRERMKSTSFDLKENYDDLKNYILSYQVKSRLSHSGDTFRLNRKDFIKITIAGKGLKIYYALNVQDYQNSTFPVGDASRKAMYREMPLFFKVKSSLSVKRAKALVDDLMKKRNLVQRGLINIKWSEEFK